MDNEQVVYEDPGQPEAVVVEDYGPEAKVIMMVVAAKDTPQTLSAERVNQLLAGWLADDWVIHTAQFLPAGPENFKLCLLMTRG